MIFSILPDFLSFHWTDAVDILLVAVLLFQLYKLVRGTAAVNIFVGIVSIYFFWLVVKALNMQLLSTILGQFIGVGVIALIIVFQQELRKFLLLIGTNGIINKNYFSSSWFRLSFDAKVSEELDINAIAKACKEMSDSKTGAIIVVSKKNDLGFYANTGDKINAKVSLRLIESIFYKNSPLHDGAIIVVGNTINAARCVLPVSENNEFPSNLGMRHRAAVGITEVTDAIAIAVSEQTGEIAFAREGKLRQHLSADELRKILETEHIHA
jgi:diadenylate cyclase